MMTVGLVTVMILVKVVAIMMVTMMTRRGG